MYNTRIEFKAGKTIEEGTGDKKEKIGLEIRLNCVKNKKGKPYRRTEVDFYLNGYLDNTKSLFYAGIRYDIIVRSGNTYEFDKHKAVGQEKFMEAMKDKDWDKVEEELWQRIK